MCSKVKIKRTKIEQGAFKKIRVVVTQNILSACPDFNKEFKIYTDDKKLQLGAVISQDGNLLLSILEN